MDGMLTKRVAAALHRPSGAVCEELGHALFVEGVLVRQDVVCHDSEVGMGQWLRCRQRKPISLASLPALASSKSSRNDGVSRGVHDGRVLHLLCQVRKHACNSPVRACRRAIGVSVPGPASTGPMVTISGSPHRNCGAPVRAPLPSLPLPLPALLPEPLYASSAEVCAAGVHSMRSMQPASAGVGT